MAFSLSPLSLSKYILFYYRFFIIKIGYARVTLKYDLLTRVHHKIDFFFSARKVPPDLERDIQNNLLLSENASSNYRDSFRFSAVTYTQTYARARAEINAYVRVCVCVRARAMVSIARAKCAGNPR